MSDLVERPNVTEMLRLLKASRAWIAGAIAEDGSGEPWLGTRTLLNSITTCIDAHEEIR